ncbi:hypothetical protein AA0117_g12274 [Alternaria alternata]|uniref:Uncharacterized protein n=1 Tax=Alternaria alternata TaxID=5599 RepID=A0A4Q4MZJ0_ALTAL|nr:hypothetical protein AA0117_g12274 [Alternaria alternata]
MLKRFNNHPQQQDEDAENGEHSDVADKARIGAKRLSRSLYPLLVNNEPLPAQNEELQHEPNVIRKRPTRRTTPATQDSDDWHGGAIFYSLKKLAHDRAQSCRT